MSQFDVKSMETVGNAMKDTVRTLQDMQRNCEDLLNSLNGLKNTWLDQDISVVIGMTQKAKKNVEEAMPYLSYATDSVVEYLQELSRARQS